MSRDDVVAELGSETTPQGYTWLAVLDAACAVVGVSRHRAIEVLPAAMRSGSGFARQYDAAAGRHVAWWVLRELGALGADFAGGGVRYSYPVIGRLFGGTDHTTVMAGVEKARRQRPDALDRVVARLRAQFPPAPAAFVDAAPAPPASGPSVVTAQPCGIGCTCRMCKRQLLVPGCA